MIRQSSAVAGPTAATPPPPDPATLRRWIAAICVIKFDLEQGQVVESTYPPNSLSAAEELEVAFNSFPDSISNRFHNRATVHDSLFFFRRQHRSASGSGFLYGYVFNRQRHDDRLKRGGDQRSVVILSPHPYTSIFRPLLQILAPLFFDIGLSAVDLVASHVSSWPLPCPGNPVDLPIGNATLKAFLPPLDDSSNAPATAPQGLFHDADLFGAFRGILLQLWELWELMIIGEPILVIAPTPPQCSEAVAGLISLVAPLPCSVDFRPYFTIHDPDFAWLNSLGAGDTFPSMVFGVTNLFFLKALRNVPHVVSVGGGGPNSGRTPPHQAPRSTSAGPGRNGARPGRLSLDQLSLNKFSPVGLFNTIKLRREGPLCLMTEHKEAVWSSYSATTKPDTSVLNRLIDAGLSPRVEESMSVVNNEILRRHFLELTTNFLAPFGPYLRATTPSEGSSPYTEPSPLPPFNADEFLRILASRGPGKFLSKRMRTNWLELYRRFLNGRNFMPWFQKRRIIAEQEQRRLWRHARMNTDINKFILTMSEVEIVDSFNAIEHHLLEEIQAQQSGRGGVDSSLVCQKLNADLQAVFNVLPKDMQELMLFNPKRTALLQGCLEVVKLPGHAFVRDAASPR